MVDVLVRIFELGRYDQRSQKGMQENAFVGEEANQEDSNTFEE